MPTTKVPLEAMPTMKNDEGSNSQGSKDGLLPKDSKGEETMKAGLMKVAVDNPLPSDEEDFKDLDGKADGKRLTNMEK